MALISLDSVPIPQCLEVLGPPLCLYGHMGPLLDLEARPLSRDIHGVCDTKLLAACNKKLRCTLFDMDLIH